jgi:hypothetical protein
MLVVHKTLTEKKPISPVARCRQLSTSLSMEKNPKKLFNALFHGLPKYVKRIPC